MKTRKIIAVDFDATLFDNEAPVPNPIPGAKEFLYELGLLKASIIIYSCRTNPRHFNVEQQIGIMQGLLQEHHMCYDRIYHGEGKPIADHYVDDRAVRCTPLTNPNAYQEALEIIK